MMRVVRWTAVIVLLLFLTHSDALAAKEPREQSWENLRQLQGGRKVQVVQMNLKSLKGTLLAVSEEAISLRVKQNEVTVPRPDVLRVSSLEQSIAITKSSNRRSGRAGCRPWRELGSTRCNRRFR